MIELNLKAKRKEEEEGPVSDRLKLTEILLQKGINPYWVARIMGRATHTKIKYYASLNPLFLKPQNYVDGLFIWTNTPEGLSFWEDVYLAFSKGNLNPTHLLEGNHHV